MALQHEALTKKIIGLFYHVYNELGNGFLEKVYENALAYELREAGYHVEQQYPIVVRYRGQVVGEYYADLVVDEKVILELKAVSKPVKQHEAQLLNYLKATPYEVGLLLNFGGKPTFERRAFSNRNKPHLRQE